MGLLTLLATAIALSMDAFAVSIADGLTITGGRLASRLKLAGTAALFFGAFQGLMPAAGFFLAEYIAGGWLKSASRVVAFVLLGAIGVKMVYETVESKGGNLPPRLGGGAFLAQAVATSIDALAAGVTFSAIGGDIRVAAPLIAATTFVISFAGATCAGFFGRLIGKKAGIIGGSALICIGIKTLAFG